jgi:hypothetical protein
VSEKRWIVDALHTLLSFETRSVHWHRRMDPIAVQRILSQH